LEVEVRMRAADGSWRWILSSGCVMEWNPDGTPKRAVGTHLDITERKRQASVEERFGRLLDGSANEIYIARADTHRLVQVNRGAREGLAYPASDLLDMTLLDLMTCSAERFEEVVRPLHDGDEEIVTFETRHRRADGSTYPVEIRLQFSREETPPVYIAIATDITDRVRYEEGLIEAKRRAEEASRMKSAMVAEVSHDVRAPLTGIIGYADLMMMVAEDDEQQQIASAILRGGERLLDTLNSVLSLSKLDSGEQPNIEPMDGIRVARDVVQDYGPHARAEGIQLSLQTANACGLRSDPVMLQRILSNLVSNAIKFTNASGRVTLRVRPEADGVCFEVEDTGVGMSPAFQERMFNAFEQETETDAGNGLGLSIVKRLVDLLEGTIEVDSRRGEGTRFRITVPSL
jgi:PAS domain S-box-containing protein